MRTRVHGPSLAVLSLALLVSTLLLPGTAGAQSEYGMEEPAVYLAVAGLAAFDDRNDLWFPNWGDADVEGGVTARVGVRLGAPAAVELQGDWIDLDAWDDNDNWTITFNMRVYPTLYEPIGLEEIFPKVLQPYLVAGAGALGGTGDNGDPYQLNGAFRLGAGTDFYVTEKIALSFGYEWLTGTGHWSKRDARNLVLGVQYNF